MYLPNTMINFNKKNDINLNEIINDNINISNNYDPIQEQFKIMSERHKQKQKQNNVDNRKEIDSEKDEINDKTETDNKVKTNDEIKIDNKEEISNNDYIKIIKEDENINIYQRNSLLNLIFNNYTQTFIEYKKHKLKLKSLNLYESELAYKNASIYDENQFYFRYQLFILSHALLEIDDYIFNNSDECLDFLYKLPYKDIDKLYKTFYANVQEQNKFINNIAVFYDLVNEPFFRMKYKVMRAFNCLPTEDRCKQMNDAQWLWLYYNLEEDIIEKMDENQDNLDYIGLYINSEAAKKIMKHNQSYRKKRDQKRKNQFTIQSDTISKSEQSNSTNTKTTNQILDNFFSSTPVSNDNTVYSTTFEKELAAALGTTDISKFSEISDDNEAGNPLETEEEFFERLKTFAPVAGTNYGYSKPERVAKLKVNRKDNYMPDSNENNNHGTRIQRYLNNIAKRQQIQNLNVDPLPIQNVSKKMPIENKSINPTTKQQQADKEFMQRMHINNLSEMDKFKQISPQQDLDFIIED